MEKRNDTGAGAVIWNLNDLYDAPDDEQIEADIDFCRQEAELLLELCRGKLGTLEASVFARSLRRIERIAENLGRVEAFAFLNYATRVEDPEATGFLQKITEISSEISGLLVFFDLEWARLPEEDAQRLLAHPETAPYHHYLLRIRKLASHLLSEQEEKLLLALQPVGRSSWTTLFDKVMAHQRFGEQKRSEEEVLGELYHPDRQTRRRAAREFSEGLRSQLHVLTHIFNTLAADKMISDRLRSYPRWDASMHLENELEPGVVTTLIDCVTSRYDLVQRYYRLKKRLLGVDELFDYDRYAPVPGMDEVTIDWKQCRKMVLESFDAFSPEMGRIARQFFDRNWIHAPVRDGKMSGAFAHPCVPDAHPYILVNYQGKMRDVSTVAHELGHGVHQVLAANQGMFNSQTPLVLAETASVFAELLVFRRQLDLLPGAAAKRAFLCQQIENIFATVFRQVAMNRFEDAMHTVRRGEGELAPERFCELWMETQKEMFGEALTLGPDYGLWWGYISHFLEKPGYVYSYAFGELLVLALYDLYRRQGDGFVQTYLQLLEAGGSASPAELLRPFGIALNEKEFWLGGLALIEEMIDEAEEEK